MITSLQNPLVKYVLKLKRKSAFRKKEKRFVVEGVRELKRAVQGGYTIEKILFCPSILKAQGIITDINKALSRVEIIEISPEVYEHLAYRGGTEGIMGIGIQKDHSPQWDLLPDDNLFLFIAEAIQKPGNVGALLRTNDAVGTHAVILVDPLTDLYNPNVIRSSLGTVFTQKIYITGTKDLEDLKKLKSLTVFAATLQNSHVYWKENYKGNIAIAVGNEAEGLSETMRKLADRFVYIPMNGIADSLNVSVSAAVILYEALRQRTEN